MTSYILVYPCIYKGIRGTRRIQEDIQGNKWNDIQGQGYKRVCKVIEGCTRVYEATEGYTRVYKALDGCTRIYEAAE